MSISRRHVLGAAGAMFCLGSRSAHANNWPQRQVRLIVPFPPGGPSDIAARMLSVRLQNELQQTVVVDYRTGANGNLGANQVARSEDGHTFLVTDIVGLAASPAVYPEMPFDPFQDLQCVGMLTYAPHMLAVHPSIEAATLAQLAALSQRTDLNIATSATGSPPHLAALQIQQQIGARWQYVPYKGSAPAATATAANQTQIVISGFSATLPMISAGMLKAVALTSRRRMARFPDIATVSESGMAGYVSGSYQGVMAASAMPADAVARMADAIRRAMQGPEVQASAAAQVSEVLLQSPQDMTAFFQAEAKRWGDVARQNQVRAV